MCTLVGEEDTVIYGVDCLVGVKHERDCIILHARSCCRVLNSIPVTCLKRASHTARRGSLCQKLLPTNVLRESTRSGRLIFPRAMEAACDETWTDEAIRFVDSIGTSHERNLQGS